MRGPRGSGLTKEARSRLFQLHHRPLVCPRPLHLWQTVRAAAIVLVSLIAGLATGLLDVLGTLGMTSTSLLGTAETGSVAVL